MEMITVAPGPAGFGASRLGGRRTPRAEDGGWRRARLVVLVCAALAAGAFGQRVSPDSELGPRVRALSADERTVRSFFDLTWSAARIDAEEKLAGEGLAQLDTLDWGALDTAARADAVMLRHHLLGVLSDVLRARARRAEMEPMLPMLGLVERLESDRAAMAELDLGALAREIGAIADEIEAVTGRIVKEGGEEDAAESGAAGESIPVSPTLALRTAGAIGDTRRIFERWHEHYAAYVPGFSWWIDTPFDDATRAMRDFEDHLREEIAGQKGGDDEPLVGDPEGRERLIEGLRGEMIAYSPEELIAIGERELAWCQEGLRAASNEMGLGDDFLAAIERVKGLHVPPGEQARLVTEQGEAAIALMRERDWVTVPELCADLWRTTMIETHNQRIWPFAAYNNNHVMVSYPTAEMDTDAKLMSMRGNNEHFTRIVVPHELIPGHHLQSFMADRVRTYRSLFRTPFFVEGWSLYWEMVLWDAGYARGPEDRVGMLFWRSHRAARIIVSLKFHLGEMTPEEMIAFLEEEVGHEHDSATSEVRRYINGMYSPLYQVAYMIGGMQLRALRAEVVDAGLMSEREYHDELLQHGSIPVEMIRAQMLDLPMGPDWEAAWRFAD